MAGPELLVARASNAGEILPGEISAVRACDARFHDHGQFAASETESLHNPQRGTLGFISLSSPEIVQFLPSPTTP